MDSFFSFKEDTTSYLDFITIWRLETKINQTKGRKMKQTTSVVDNCPKFQGQACIILVFICFFPPFNAFSSMTTIMLILQSKSNC